MEDRDQSPGGDGDRPRPLTAAEKHALAERIGRFLGRMGAMGQTLARRYRLPQWLCDGDDVVGRTLVKLWRAVEAGTLRPLPTDADFQSLVVVILDHEALLARERFGRRKGGGGAGTLRRSGEDLEAMDSHACPPDIQVISAQQVAEWLELLEGFDPLLRRIVTMRLQGFRNEEIAASLDRSLRAVEGRLSWIRSILESQGLARES